MFRIALRGLLAKKIRLVTTGLAVVIGVALTVGTMTLADTMNRSLGSAVEVLADGVDGVVRGEVVAEMGGGGYGERAPVPLDTVGRVAAADGVAAAEPSWEGYAQIVGADGKVVDVMQTGGFNWVDDPELSMFSLVEGRTPQRAGDVVLDTGASELGGLGVGDDVEIATSDGVGTYRVTGVAEVAEGGSLGRSAFALFSDADAERLLGTPGTADAVLARAADGVGEDELAEAVGAAVPGYDVVTGSEYAEEFKGEVETVSSVFERSLLVFAAIALVVGSFTISNTFTITLAQRTRELALLRAVGAGRRQVVGSVVAEALLQSAAASAIGIAAGLGVAQGLVELLALVGLDLPAGRLALAPSTVVVGALVGIVVTVLAAAVPAVRASRTPPVAAMRDSVLDGSGSSRARLVTGLLLATVGGAALVGGVLSPSTMLVGVGALITFYASIVLGPVIARGVMTMLAGALRVLGPVGRIAGANAARNPKRSAATAAALTVGVMLVSSAAMFAETTKATISDEVEQTVVADRVVRPAGTTFGVPAPVAQELAAVPGLDVAPVRQALGDLEGEALMVTGFDWEASADVLRLDVVEGSLPTSSGSVAVTDVMAAEHGWSVGDTVTLTLANGGPAQVELSGTYAQSQVVAAVVAPYETVVAGDSQQLDGLVLVSGATPALDAAAEIVETVPTAVWETVPEFAASRAGLLDLVLSLVVGLLGLAVLIAVLGIATTIGLSVRERTRELGVLRSIGMSRRQLRTSIRLEAVAIAGFGTLLGLAMGLGFTGAALSTLTEAGFAAPQVPTTALGAVVVGALVAGLAAAALPARGAARMPILDAVRSE